MKTYQQPLTAIVAVEISQLMTVSGNEDGKTVGMNGEYDSTITLGSRKDTSWDEE